MKFTAEYQYRSWEGRKSSGWWIECEQTFASKRARKKFISNMNTKFSNIMYREKGEVKECDTVTIYTDGSSYYKDRTGGIGVYMKYKKHEMILSKGYVNTTNNRMELRAVIEGMKLIKAKEGFRVHIYSDSEYVVNIATAWAVQWEEFGFAGKKNSDLIKEFLEEFRKFKSGTIEFKWCKGHNGIEGNEIADILASEGRKSNDKIKCQ